MKFTGQFKNSFRLICCTAAGGFLLASTGVILRSYGEEASKTSSTGEELFSTPEDAVTSLKSATALGTEDGFIRLFGPGFKSLKTGDKIQDANDQARFAGALREGCSLVTEGDNKMVIEIGTNQWPMPSPLLKSNGMWYFSTASGKEEILNRHIGRDELSAIGVARAYVTAQFQFAAMNKANSSNNTYALKFKSTPGLKDGLYWEIPRDEAADPSVPASPFGPLVASAHAEGYGRNKGTGMHPFHGYYFRILTRQGKNASGGKKDYISQGALSGGFALVAYPQHYAESGIMTFIVNQDGKVFQKDLGQSTSRIAGSIKEYDPDKEWTAVEDAGIPSAVTEK